MWISALRILAYSVFKNQSLRNYNESFLHVVHMAWIFYQNLEFRKKKSNNFPQLPFQQIFFRARKTLDHWDRSFPVFILISWAKEFRVKRNDNTIQNRIRSMWIKFGWTQGTKMEHNRSLHIDTRSRSTSGLQYPYFRFEKQHENIRALHDTKKSIRNISRNPPA